MLSEVADITPTALRPPSVIVVPAPTINEEIVEMPVEFIFPTTLPLNVPAVIIPATNPPVASRATIALNEFADDALDDTVNV